MRQKNGGKNMIIQRSHVVYTTDFAPVAVTAVFSLFPRGTSGERAGERGSSMVAHPMASTTTALVHAGQAGGGDRLAVAFVFLVGNVESDLAGQLGKFLTQHCFGAF